MPMFLLVEIGKVLGDDYETIRALCSSPEKARGFCPYKSPDGKQATWFKLGVKDENEPFIECFEIRAIEVDTLLENGEKSWYETSALVTEK